MGEEAEPAMREEAEEEASDEPVDDLGRAIADAKRNCASDLEKKKLQRMLEDHKKLLYPNCVGDKKKLGTTLELLQWKAENGVSDKGFGKLLVMIKNMLPKDNEFPESTYEATKAVCPLGLEVQKIHACPHDCILYRGEYEDLNACPVCGATSSSPFHERSFSSHRQWPDLYHQRAHLMPLLQLLPALSAQLLPALPAQLLPSLLYHRIQGTHGQDSCRRPLLLHCLPS